MTLTERLPGKPVPADHGFLAERRLRRWAARYAPDWFERRLSADRVTEDDLRALLAEPVSALVARIPQPEWAHRAESAVAAAPVRPTDSGFAQLLAPFRDLAVAEFTDRPVPHTDVEGLAGQFGHQLEELLAGLAVRALDKGQLAGRAGLIALFSEYPVLARVLAETSRRATEAHLESLTRFGTDRERLTGALLGGVEPGALVSLETGRGDRHRGGRSVSVLTFASGARVVYKPRDLRAEARFADLVRLLNEALPNLRLRTAEVLVRPGYGWMEYIEPAPLAEMSAAFLFYRRLGALLAILHLVHASDMHSENLIAAADQPVLIDAETLFHPRVGRPARMSDPAAAWLGDSVLRTWLLPFLTVGAHGAADLSGIGGDAGFNRPALGGRPLEPARHADAVLAGFREAYDAIACHRTEFAARLRACADVPVRVVVRSTRGYAVLLAESTNPDVLRDALDRDLLLDVLWTESVDRPLWWRLAGHERDDLCGGDIPLFTTTPEDTAVHTSAGQPVLDALAEPLLPVVLDRLAAFGPADRDRQEWLISATLATRGQVGDRSPLGKPGPPGTTGHLLDAARGIADDILARALLAGGRINWVGLQRVEDRHWMVLPMGASLADGYLGVALFLSELAALTGIRRYAHTARRALRTVPDLLDTLAAQPELIAAVGCGGYHGFGGISHALTRMSTSLDPGLRPLAERATDLAATAHELADHRAFPVRSGDADRYAAARWALAAQHGRRKPTSADLFAARDLSLGHGALGVADAVLVGGEPAAAELDELRGTVLSLLAAAGPRCATPNGVPTVGLLDGTAGIGLGLLRLAYPDQVPSVLLLQPSPLHERTGSNDTRPQPTPDRAHGSTGQRAAA